MKNKRIVCCNGFENGVKTALFVLGGALFLLLLNDIAFCICSYTVFRVFHNSEGISLLSNLMCELWSNYTDRIIRIGIFACILYLKHFFTYRA